MVKIRLTRVGRRNAPYYRMVVADERRQRDGRHIEILGQYQPLRPSAEPHVEINRERALYWLNVGAQPSETVRSILARQGIMKEFHDAKVAARKNRQAAKN